MTTHTLRPYQAAAKDGIYQRWQHCRSVLAVLPTGAGKTVLFSAITGEFPSPVCAIAHRSELVSQMSLALAREGVRHRVIGPDAVRRVCVQAHLDELKRSYYDPNARCAVAGVDTLVRLPESDPWLASVGLTIIDEAHHVLRDNKWGRACAMFPNARLLGVTATPIRADGKGLGHQADGLFDEMVLGPTMRELIEAGYLTDYRVVCPPSDIDLSQVHVGASGDYVPKELKQARRRSTITGDVVSNYLKFAGGKLGVTFDTDVESATETAAAFRAAGVPSEVVSADTPAALRASIIARFRAREVRMLVNVDLFGEGFDLPAIEVVVMARPTQSFSLYCQQFGRSLRIMEGKTRALIIDHVGNIVRHGLPDKARVWSLDRRERRSRSAPNDAVPMRNCLNPECLSAYERIEPACPFCGHEPEPAARNAPEFVDGDLVMLDEDTLAKLRGEISRVDGAVRIPSNLSGPAGQHLKNLHLERQQAQRDLRAAMDLWCGWQVHRGLDVRRAQRKFFLAYGVDVLSAHALGRPEAETLRTRIEAELNTNGVIPA